MNVVSLSTPDIKAYAEATAKNHADYCKKHGYDYIHFWDTEIKPASWAKFSLLSSLPDGLTFWIDADAVFMNTDRRIEEFHAGFDFTFSLENQMLNAGVFVVKMNKRVRNVLSGASRLEMFKNHPHWDNAALIQYFKMHQAYAGKNVRMLSNLAVNGMIYKTGDFIVHLCGTTFEERVNLFNNKFR